MKKEANKALIGAFIVGAGLLSVIGILALGGGNLFQASTRYVMYFTGSVKGLSVGAPVQFKGIAIGKVTDINLIYDPEKESYLNQVILEVPKGLVKLTEESRLEDSERERLQSQVSVVKMIADGLRAKLQLQSFVTGQLLVALDFYPDTPVTLMGFTDDLREVPTLPSDMDALAKTIHKVDFQAVAESIKNAAKGIDKLANSLDLHEMVITANDTLKGYRRLAANLDRHVALLSAEVTKTLTDVRQLLKTTNGQILPMATGINDTTADIRKAVVNLDARLQPVLGNIEETVAATRVAFQQAEAMLTNLTYLSDEDSALVYRIDETLAEMEKAAGVLTVLADYLSRHPEALLQGKKAAGEMK